MRGGWGGWGWGCGGQGDNGRHHSSWAAPSSAPSGRPACFRGLQASAGPPEGSRGLVAHRHGDVRIATQTRRHAWGCARVSCASQAVPGGCTCVHAPMHCPACMPRPAWHCIGLRFRSRPAQCGLPKPGPPEAAAVSGCFSIRMSCCCTAVPGARRPHTVRNMPT